MKKSILLTFLTLVLALCTIGLTACGGGINGKYYLYEDGKFDKSSWVLIDDDYWEDDDGVSGRVEISGQNIILFCEIFGEEEEIFSGKIKDGCLTLGVLGAEEKFYKENATVKVSVTFNSNGGSFSNGETEIIQDEIAIKSLLKEPDSPTRENYTFLGWAKNASGTSAWQFSTDKVNKDTTLYAVWTCLDYTYINGGCVLNGIKDNSITEIMIPDFITSIADNAFKNNKKLDSVTFADNSKLKTIGESAFYGCSLTDIIIPESVETIGGSAFAHCNDLINISIPREIQNIGDKAFYGCKIEQATLPGECVSAIEKENLKSIIINGGTSIVEKAFYDCKSLKSITLPDSIINVGNDAFTLCQIEEATLPATFISMIPKSNLKTIIINGGTSIERSAFSNCKTLRKITISDGITSIDNHAFYGCSSLTDISIPNSVTSLGEYVFSDCQSLKSIVIPDGVKKIEEGTFYGCESLTGITIPNSVSGVGKFAFSNCKTLTDIIIPDGVDYIGEGAFYGCSSLKSVIIPNSLTSLGDGGVFSECPQLNYNVYNNANYLGNDNNPYLVLVSAISKDISNCQINSATKIICNTAFVNCKSLKSIVIPDGVTAIGDFAFYNCETLTNITIPESVTRFGHSTFSKCYALSDITYKGTTEQWEEFLSYGWAFRIGEYTVHCKNSDIEIHGKIN